MIDGLPRTVLAHVIAASLVVLVSAGHSDPEDTVNLLRPVQTALEIFETYSACSDLAKKGIVVLKSLIRTVESPSSSGSGEEAVSGDFVGSAGKDLKRAIGILRRKKDSPSMVQNGLLATVSTPPSSSKSETLTSISPEDQIVPLWKADWASSSGIDPSLELMEEAQGLSGLQTEDLFDTLFGLGDDSGMWDYRGLDLG